MDSEESRPRSSASNSSNSSYTSQHSSPAHLQEEVDNELEGEGANVEGENLNSNNVSSPSGTRFRTKSESGSSTSSSSSSSSSAASDEENDKNFTEGDEENNTVKSGGQKRSSSSEEEEESNQFQSQNDTLKSPSLKSGGNSSRKSSVSSIESLAKTDDQEDGDLNISHEDLSDISENESEKRPASSNNNILADDDDISNASFSHQTNKISTAVVEEREVVNNEFSKEEHNDDDAGGMPEKDTTSSISKNEENVNGLVELVVKSHDDEDALDFEAEEGECAEASKEAAEVTKNEQNNKEEKSDGEAEEGEELEEGEVTDEEDKRPEENEPKPVCRFYTRGQCTWGMSCRFLHPGVTDKGNYTMFENMVRSVPVAQSSVGIRGSAYGTHLPEYHDYRNERPNLHHRGAIHHSATLFPNHAESRPLVSDGPVVVENAWERGLRTAKEMMRKANKRKEQDMDFEDKKMNLTVSPDDLEKEPYYIKERERISPPEFNIYSPPDRFGRTVHGGPPVLDEIDPYGRSARYRELPPHRMPHYEDERRVRPTREVIVQRVEPPGRGDEWNDPWMRSKSPGTRGGSRDHGEKRRRDHHSYSSNSSYSSSSSSQSDSSSESSQSSSPLNSRRRYNTSSNISATMARKQRSPSVQHRRGRHSPNTGFSPSKRHGIPSSPTNKRTYSPIQKRKKLSPYVNKKFYSEKNKAKRRHTTSSSASGSSSDSSGSESDTDTGSSSTDSSRSRKLTQTKRSRTHDKVQHSRKHARKPEPSKKRSPISIEIKKPMTVGTSALVSPSNSLSSEKDNKKSRREELLKQLRAVEDAIAKKRSKLS